MFWFVYTWNLFIINSFSNFMFVDFCNIVNNNVYVFFHSHDSFDVFLAGRRRFVQINIVRHFAHEQNLLLKTVHDLQHLTFIAFINRQNQISVNKNKNSIQFCCVYVFSFWFCCCGSSFDWIRDIEIASSCRGRSHRSRSRMAVLRKFLAGEHRF